MKIFKPNGELNPKSKYYKYNKELQEIVEKIFEKLRKDGASTIEMRAYVQVITSSVSGGAYLSILHTMCDFEERQHKTKKRKKKNG